MKTLSKFLLLFALLPSLAYGQVTAGFHRVNQIISRGTSGVTAQIVPGASVFVASTATGLAATIYSDPLLTLPITGAILTTDNNGNYDYYLALNTCVTETISYPSAGTLTIANICGNAGLALPLGTLNGGTGTTTAPIPGQLLVGQTGSAYFPETLSGDCTIASSGAITCTKTNGTPFTSAATTPIGTTGAAIPLLSTANTWGQDQTIATSNPETSLILNNLGSKSWSLKVFGGLLYFTDNTDTVTPLSLSSTVITANVPMNVQGSPVCTSTNGVCATGTGTLTNFSTGSWPSWLTPTVSNPTAAPVLSVSATAIPNSALSNSTFTINTTTTCTLGANCNLPGTTRTCNANGCYTVGTDGTITEWGRIGPFGGGSAPALSVTFPYPLSSGSVSAGQASPHIDLSAKCTTGSDSGAGVWPTSLTTTGFYAVTEIDSGVCGSGTVYGYWSVTGW